MSQKDSKHELEYDPSQNTLIFKWSQLQIAENQGESVVTAQSVEYCFAETLILKA